MKIRILRNLGLGMPSLAEGQETDVDEELAELLIKRNLAEPLSLKAVPKPTLKGVSEPPEGSVEKATRDVQEYAAKAKGKKSEVRDQKSEASS